jgi:aspartate carbamoyltransferase catalytic subunit
MKPQRSQPSRHLPLGDRRDAPFYGKDILGVGQFRRADLHYIFGVAHEMREMVTRVGSFDLLKGKILANLFYEPSTRTMASFTAAMERLGGSVIPITEVHYSSVAKGESLPDTVRTLEAYADVIVLRHPQVGAAAEAAHYARKPIINAGDGVGEHPTQALLDLFTIHEEQGTVDGLTVTMVGDLRYGRTVHSLARLLTRFDVKMRFVSPEMLRLPEALRAELDAAGVAYEEVESLDEALAASDVLYVTRVQKERFDDLDAYERVKNAYVITAETMGRARASMTLMHPFPRVGEIAMEVDADPRAAYFRQMEYGLFVRMALLAMVLGKA